MFKMIIVTAIEELKHLENIFWEYDLPEEIECEIVERLHDLNRMSHDEIISIDFIDTTPF